MYQVLSEYLNNAFKKMKISYKSITDNGRLIYRLDMPHNEICDTTVTVVIDDLFSAEVYALIAQGITAEFRTPIIEIMNQLNGEFRFLKVQLDQHNDIYSNQTFILVGNENIMCKQIITNLLAFCDIHHRASAKIQAALM